jgi:hypothetical protein
MSAEHGTHSRYSQGCRCDACTEGHRLTALEYAQRKAAGQVRPRVQVAEIPPPSPNGPPEPGPVEAAVHEEINGMAAETRPGLVAIALAMARLLDNPKAVNQQPAAAKVLAAMLEKLRQASAPGRRGHLAAVKSMTTSSPSA